VSIVENGAEQSFVFVAENSPSQPKRDIYHQGMTLLRAVFQKLQKTAKKNLRDDPPDPFPLYRQQAALHLTKKRKKDENHFWQVI
jgi:hypothetical protein